MNFPDLRGDRVDLIEINENGLSDMHEYSKIPEFYEFMEFGEHCGIDETKEYLSKLIRRSSVETGHYWFIQLKTEKKIIGTFGLLEIDRRKGSAEIGYGLSTLYQGKGFFRECLRLVLAHLFNEQKFHRVWAKTQADNIPSIKALEKVGFRREGVLRDFYLSMKDGKYRDAALLGILNSEFSPADFSN